MQEAIELSVESPDGIIDCRLEPELIDEVLTYSATILYPQNAGGYSRSDIYCYTMEKDAATGSYVFSYGDEGIHPKIKKLEAQLAQAINTQIKEARH